MSEANEVSLAEAVAESTPSEWLDAHDDTPESEDAPVHDMDVGSLDLGVKPEEPEEAAEEVSEDASEEASEEEETPEEAETDGAEGKAEEPDEEDGDYEKAISALRRGKLSKEVIGKLTRAEILREGLAMAQLQAATDAKFDEHSRIVKELKEQQAKAESEKEPGGVESTGHPLTATLSEASQKFSEALGVEASEVEPFAAELSKAISAPMQEQMSQGVQVLEQLNGIVGSLLFRTARAELSSGEQARYPQLADSKTYAPIQEKALALLASGSYADMDPVDARIEALSDATGIVLRPDLERAAMEKATKERAARERGNVRPPATKQSSAPASEEEKAFALLDELEKRHS